jgi:hypothetical protein
MRKTNFPGLSFLSNAFQSALLDKPQYIISATKPDGAISPIFPEGGALDVLASDSCAFFA